MTAVTQRIPNFLGGVSQQADEKIFPGQVKDALNCYPDPTLGMIKRPGGKFLGKLAGITAGTLDNASWFTIPIDQSNTFIGCVSSSGVLRVWDINGNASTITYPSGSVSTYLTASASTSIKTLTINDFTYICNSEKQVTEKTPPTFNVNRQATIVLNTVSNNTRYRVTIGSTDYDYTHSSGTIATDTFINGISSALPAVGGNLLSKTTIGNTIYLTFNSATSVKTDAGPTGTYLTSFQDSVPTFNKLPEQANHGRVVEVTNSDSPDDNYYLEFIANNTTYNVNGTVNVAGSGPGYWQECESPKVSKGFNANTMPIALVCTSTSSSGTFVATFLDGTYTAPNGLLLAWEDRIVGDDSTNPQPSFVDNTIDDMFLFSNRLGFLSLDNVIMSRAGDYFNFYSKSALTQIAADPIDLSVSSTRPAFLHSTIPITQGLLLFSDNQQFLMEAENGAFTPDSVSIRTISSYDNNGLIKPVDLGSTVLYVSKNSNWTKAFEMYTRGQRENPVVNESSKPVPEWIPANVNKAEGSTQIGIWVASSNSTKDLYLFRFYDRGEERVLAAWFRWTLPCSKVMITNIQDERMYVVSSDAGGYIISQFNLVVSSSSNLLNSAGRQIDPYLDQWQEINSGSTYRQATDDTKIYIGSHFTSSYTLRYVIGTSGTPGNTLCGYTNTTTFASDGGGKYIIVPGNVSTHYIYVGYEYNMEITLPKYYYSMGEQGADYTATTTTARMSFYTGLGGDIYFNIKDNSRPEWSDVSGNTIAEFYQLDNSPFRDTYVYKVPIHQRPQNYSMKVTSNTPFPVSLVSMMWEGQYTPGFYRRA